MIVEWLQLDGFLSLSNLPVAVSKVGGRFEADVVGARVKGGQLEIRHIETGVLGNGRKSTASITKKFGDPVISSVKKHFKTALSYKGPEPSYEKIYVATYWTEPVIRDLERVDINVVRLPDFILSRVLPAVRAWQENPPHQPLMKGPRITLPECLWLSQMLDHLRDKGLLVADWPTDRLHRRACRQSSD